MTRAEYEAKYGTAPAVATSTPIKMTRAEYEAKYGAPVQAPKYNPVDTLKGKTTFPANTETSNPLGNVARTFGNIPSDAFGIARAAVAPVNPLDTGSSLNIGANLSKGFGAVKDIVKNRGLGGGLKDIAGGFADTATKVFKAPGEFIVGETMKAAQNPAQYASDAATAVSKIGIEHPLLVPSLIYGSGAKPIAPALDEATKLSTLGDNTVNLAKKLTQRSEKQIASSVLGNYKAGVKPLINAKTTPSLAAKYDEKVVNAVKTIKDNKAGLVFTDEAGAPITGQSPKTLQQFSDAVEQTKKTVFSQYDDLAKKAGEAGVRVEVAPIGTELDTVINNKALALTNPKAIKYAQELQDRLANTGALDATTAQEVIQNYNKSLEAFYRNPSYDNASQAAIDSLVANKMRETLDAGISGMTGTQYSALKSQYGALKAIEKDVIKAAIRDARKNTKGLIDMTDVFSGGQVVNGILSMNPGMIASGATQKGIAAFYKYLNNPNRAINALFKEADKLPVQSFQGKNLPNQSLLQTPAASVIPKTVSTNPMGTNVAPIAKSVKSGMGIDPLIAEARRYKTAEEFYNAKGMNDSFRSAGVRGQEQFRNFWEEATKGMDKSPIIETLNPTGGVLVDYSPDTRASAKLGKNITTLADTMGKSPDSLITIYRGAPKSQKSIVAGDFISTDYNSARSYIGSDGKVLEMKVKLGDILDDKTEPLGGDYLYRPGAHQELIDLFNKANKK
jgi:hypothetical protein